MRDPQITHKIMSSIRSKDTEPELLLRKCLWKNGFRYRVNVKNLPGKPDIVFTKVKLAVFCDGDFWHGHNWVLRGLPSLEDELARYTEFWKNKILRNMERDVSNTKKLEDAGWMVLRFWESDIRANPDKCVKEVIVCYHDLKKKI